MKRLILMLLFVLTGAHVMIASEVMTDVTTAFTDGLNGLLSADFVSLMGLTTIVSTILIEMAKKIKWLEQTWAYILTAIVIGIAVCFAGWFFGLSPQLEAKDWWVVLIAGALTGVGSCGFYDFVELVWNRLFKK